MLNLLKSINKKIGFLLIMGINKKTNFLNLFTAKDNKKKKLLLDLKLTKFLNLLLLFILSLVLKNPKLNNFL